MECSSTKSAAFVAAGWLALAPLCAQGADYAAPTRLQAGDKFLGAGRMYPSPVFHDVDGDGRSDLVVGDLVGHLTVALRQPGDTPRFGAEHKLKATDGQDLDFANW